MREEERGDEREITAWRCSVWVGFGAPKVEVLVTAAAAAAGVGWGLGAGGKDLGAHSRS